MADIIRGLIDGTGVEVSNADARYRQGLEVDSSYIPMAGSGNDYINSPMYSDGTIVTLQSDAPQLKITDGTESALISLSTSGDMTLATTGIDMTTNAQIKAHAFRDDHQGWLMDEAHRANLLLATNNGGSGGMYPLIDSFKRNDNWKFFDASNIDGLDTRGYLGGTFDGRYVYFSPYYNSTLLYHGILMRYDVTEPMDSSTSYETFDMGNTSGLNTKGYGKAAYDGQYIYFSPIQNTNTPPYLHGNVVRYNTREPFNSSSSYVAYDASNTSGLNTVGYYGNCFDGKYVYFTPYKYYDGDYVYSANILRYNTESDFTDSSSWIAYDASGTSGLNTIGYRGVMSDGRYLYFCPWYNGTQHGNVLRYDSSGDFTNSGSWIAYNASGTDGFNTTQFSGASFDGRFIYFCGNNAILRYDTARDFTNSNAWSAIENYNVDGLFSRGYSGAFFDGRYMHFIPIWNTSYYHGVALRYDTAKSFYGTDGWETLDISNPNYGDSSAIGYNGVAFDGRHIYMTPYYNGTNYSSYVARYDAKSRIYNADVIKGAISEQFFLDSTGRLGLGTVTPTAAVDIYTQDTTQLRITTGTEQLSISLSTSGDMTLATTGIDMTTNVQIKAHAFRDDHQGWLMDEAQRANLILATNNGGSGGMYPLIDSFKRNDNWKFFDASNVDGLDTRGYRGGTFDGRYVYLSPHYYSAGGGYHGNLLRYDVTEPFDTSNSYDSYNMGNTSGMNTTGYTGAAYDGQYIYFAPYRDSANAYHGRVVRYNTRKPLKSSSSYVAYDAGTTSGLSTKGYYGNIYDGRYVYFVPNYNGSYHGNVLRYDTEESFTSSGSWVAYDASGTSGLNTVGYAYGTSDGRYLYFAPNYSISGPHGNALRYDSSGDFTNSGSWIAYDASGTDGFNTTQFTGASFDGRFIYYSGRNAMLRYDTARDFTNSDAWSAVEKYNIDGLVTKGYFGSFFDGRYMHFCPFNNSTSFHGNALRYDTAKSFYGTDAWESYNVVQSGGLQAVGYSGVAFDGRHIYMSPYYDATTHSGYIGRYDAKSRIYNADVMKGAISEQFFLDGTGRLGLGTVTPTAKIDMWSTDATQLRINYDPTTQTSLSLSPTGDLSIKTTGDDLNLIVDGTDGKITTNASFSADQALRDHNSWVSNVQNNTEMTLKGQGSGLAHLKDNFYSHDNWDFFSPGKVDGLDTSGYVGGTFDGRYVYYSPYYTGTSTYHGNLLRYDTVKAFDETSSYSAFNLATINANYKGYQGACFDGQYVYLSPLNNGAFHGNVIQYNTRLPLNLASSYKAYDASGTSGLDTQGYNECSFDGKHVYFVPTQNASGGGYHGYILRYNTEGDFTSSGSWSAYDASGTSGIPDLVGFMNNPAYDGRYLYFTGTYNGVNHGRVLKYDSSGDFTNSASWSAFNTETVNANALALRGNEFDGRFIYFCDNGPTLRYDTEAAFDNTNSWTSFDRTGFSSAIFDGRYVTFSPYYNGSDRVSTAARYDTAKSFTDNDAWEILDISQPSYGGSSAKGYRGSIYDKRYIYHVATYNGVWFNLMARYDTHTSGFYQDIKKAALSKEFYIDSKGKIGIGTTTPDARVTIQSSDATQLKITDGTEQLSISLTNSGNTTLATSGADITTNAQIKAHAFRDDHQGWLMDEAQRANLILATNNGGSGGMYPLIDSFKRNDNWKFFDASNVDGLDTSGYSGGTFDGRYVYYAPLQSPLYHGNVLRYDVTKPVDSSNSYDAYNMGSVGGLNTTGYIGATYDGKYVYYGPFRDSDNVYHGRVVRYNTREPLKSPDSYSVYDAGTTSGLSTKGYRGNVYDGRYVYFSPNYNNAYHGNVLRYDTENEFTSSSSWIAYDASGTSGLNTIGYRGVISDGRYLYFCPWYNGTQHGNVLRYDSSGDFTNSGSWIAYDASGTDGFNTTLFSGASFDGRFIYFSGRNAMLRYDTAVDFTNSNAWSAIENYNVDGLSTRGYFGGFFDGRYMHFIPEYNTDLPNYNGNALRYDTAKSFYGTDGWEALDLTVPGGSLAKGYQGVAFDGRHIYMVPFRDDTAATYNTHIAVFDAKSRIYNADVMKGAISEQFFLDGTGRLGLGTVTPTEKLEVNGNMKIEEGGYNNGHLLLGNYHLWIDTTGNLRVNNGSPATDADGTVVGTQS